MGATGYGDGRTASLDINIAYLPNIFITLYYAMNTRM